MSKNTSVVLGEYFEEFVDQEISIGRFRNTSEVIRAGLRLLEEEENKAINLRNAIREGIESGLVKNFDPEALLVKMKSDRRKNGKI